MKIQESSCKVFQVAICKVEINGEQAEAIELRHDFFGSLFMTDLTALDLAEKLMQALQHKSPEWLAEMRHAIEVAKTLKNVEVN